MNSAKSGPSVNLFTVLLTSLALMGCAATMKQPPVSSSGSESKSMAAVQDGVWTANYTGSGDFFERDQGWSRDRKAWLMISSPLIGNKGVLSLNGTVGSEDFRRYGFNIEVPVSDSPELSGSQVYHGETAVYRFVLDGENVTGRLGLYDGPTDGHPRVVYDFRVVRSQPIAGHE